jgi:hypothetical protein
VSSREGRCGTTSRAELLERPGEPGCENNPIQMSVSGFQRPTWSGHPGRNPQDGFVLRRTTHGSPQGQKRRRRRGHGEAMRGAMAEGTSSMLSATDGMMLLDQNTNTRRFQANPKTSIFSRLVVLALGHPRFHIYQVPLPFG